MNSANPVPTMATNGPATHQPNNHMGSSNQVRVSDACRHQQQPPPPHRSSSLLPTLRRRASEPLPHSHRQRYTQRPGETHTRYTYGFNRRERRSGYTFGLAQRDIYDDEKDACSPDNRYQFGFVPHSQTLNLNLNRESYEYGYRCNPTLVDTQGHTTSDNAHMFVDAQDCKSRHARSLMPDTCHSSQSNSYTENIRAMAGQMYGEPPTHTHSRIPNRNTSADRYADAHSYTHNQALTRHLQL